MVDVDRIACIFGSFARRKPHHDSTAKRKVMHDRSKSAPDQSIKIEKDNSRAKSHVFCESFENDEFKCPICRKQFDETRVLPCLHTFCLKCVLKLENESSCRKSVNTNIKSRNKWYVTENSNDESMKICCPLCYTKSEIPFEGAKFLHPNYPIQHKMVLATMNSKYTHLLCDLCVVDVSAKSRCMDCMMSFCRECEENHLRQKYSAGHEVLSLENAREKGITKVRRCIMCLRHPGSELSIFCNTCCDVVCSECVKHSHQNHSFDLISKVCESHLGQLKSAVYKTKHLLTKSAQEIVRLSNASIDVEDRCNTIQVEVQNFMDGYIKAIEDHKERLLERIRQYKNKKLDYLSEEKIKLQKKVRDARDLTYFLNDILNNGVEAEILSYLKPVLRKIKHFEAIKTVSNHNLLVNMQFRPSKAVELPKSEYNLYGEVTTHSVVPELSTLTNETLQDSCVGERINFILETRDEYNCRLRHGGASVSAEILQKKAGVFESYNLDIRDNRNGTYTISFVPEHAGEYDLHVRINDQPLKHCPHTFMVQPASQHSGLYHCCSFCSSGGSKNGNPCGCGGQIPGGYKGCGHGHVGHPGQRHWSCCGGVGEYSECTRRQYQFTL